MRHPQLSRSQTVRNSNAPMISPETPTEQAPQTSSSEPQTPALVPDRIRIGRHGELETHELLYLLDSIEDERARSRFRESVYISLFIWLAVAWFVFYGPRVLWHQPKLRNPAEVLRERELTQLHLPNLPPVPSSAPKAAPRPAPKPALDNKTLEKIREMAPPAKPEPAPSAANPPAAAQPTAPTPTTPPPPPPTVPTPQPRTPPPVVAEAPTPQPTKPNFGRPSSAGSAIQDAIAAAARNRGSGGIDTGRPSSRSGPLNIGGAEVLSDTEGVNFDPYLRRILGDIKRNWDPLIPPEAQSPLFKQGEAYIRFTILPDGSIGAMHLDGSTHDEAINRSCWGSITSEGQFPPLPSQFHGPNLELRIHYLVNKGLPQ